jgi:hypothetical protein
MGATEAIFVRRLADDKFKVTTAADMGIVYP